MCFRSGRRGRREGGRAGRRPGVRKCKKNKEIVNELDGEFFSQYNNTTIPFRSFALSFKYTLGKLSFKDPKTRIKNTDIIKDNDNNF